MGAGGGQLNGSEKDQGVPGQSSYPTAYHTGSKTTGCLFQPIDEGNRLVDQPVELLKTCVHSLFIQCIPSLYPAFSFATLM